MKYVTRILIALVILAILSSCTPATTTTPSAPPEGTASAEAGASTSAAPDTPTGAPSSDEPPAGDSPDSTAPAFTVTTLDNTDITARVAELWSFANDLYRPRSSGEKALYSTENGWSRLLMVDEFADVADYFTDAGVDQLYAARFAYDPHEPIFYRRYGETYRAEHNGAIFGGRPAVDMTTIISEPERMILAVTHPGAQEFHTHVPDNIVSTFTIRKVDGRWLVDDYKYNSIGFIYTDMYPADENAYLPLPSREDMLASLPLDRELMRATRRLYFLQNCSAFDVNVYDVDTDSFVWQDDHTFTFSLHDGAPYSVYFYTAAEIASRSPDDEIFDCTLDALPLEADSLDFFNTEYFNAPADDPRRSLFPNQFLTSEYATPDDIDLYQLFYNGFTADLTDVERAYCEQNGFAMNLDIQRTTAAEMREILEQYTGLSDGFERGLDEFLYNPDTDAYYLCHGDTNAITVTFTSGWYYPDGRVTLRYTAVDYTYPNDAKPMELTLQRVTADTYHIISNLSCSAK